MSPPPPYSAFTSMRAHIQVRTTDEASLDLKFVITMQLHNVEKMLDASKDPIRSLALAMSADVLGFGGAHTLEEMLIKTAELNNLDSFPRLRAAAEEAGFNIMNVLCKGYKSSPELEQMWAETVSTRQRQRMQAAHEAADTVPETEHPHQKLNRMNMYNAHTDMYRYTDTYKLTCAPGHTNTGHGDRAAADKAGEGATGRRRRAPYAAAAADVEGPAGGVRRGQGKGAARA